MCYVNLCKKYLKLSVLGTDFHNKNKNKKQKTNQTNKQKQTKKKKMYCKIKSLLNYNSIAPNIQLLIFVPSSSKVAGANNQKFSWHFFLSNYSFMEIFISLHLYNNRASTTNMQNLNL